MYEEQYNYELPNEFQVQIDSIIEQEVNNRCSEIINDNKSKEEKIKKLESELKTFVNKTKEFDKILTQINEFQIFKDLINVNNFSNFIKYLNLKHNNFEISGMDVENIPEWFKLLFRYYEDRQRLFTLMDMFNIEYPAWAKEYKMPYDYTKEELTLFIDPKYNRYITNGCIFEHNIGFFWTTIKANKGNTYRILTTQESFAHYIPWQLVLSNPLWKEPDMFDLIVNAIKKGYNDSHYYFYIQNYLDIPEDMTFKIAEYLPKDRFYDSHKIFIKNNPKIFTNNPELAEKFKDKINNSKYTSFYYLNYPLNIQIDYIKNYKGSLDTKLNLIKNMKISKDEKIKLTSEIVETYLEK